MSRMQKSLKSCEIVQINNIQVSECKGFRYNAIAKNLKQELTKWKIFESQKHNVIENIWLQI